MEEKIEIEKEICLGCELCANKFPDLFELVDGHSQVKKDANLSKVDFKKLEEFANECPSLALSIIRREKETV
jgi:ferredoxin